MKKTESIKIVTTIAVAAIIAAGASMLVTRTPATFAQSPSDTGANAADTGENATSTASNQPKIHWQQGIVTSAPDPLPGHSSHQAAMILSPKGDGTVYSGVLTFTATKKVEVQVLHNMKSNYNQTANSDTFGEILSAPLPPDNKTTVAISLIVPDYGSAPAPSASIPFTGNAIALHTLNGNEFAASYSVMYEEGKAKTVDNISSATSGGMTPSGNMISSTTNSTTTNMNTTMGSNSTGE